MALRADTTKPALSRLIVYGIVQRSDNDTAYSIEIQTFINCECRDVAFPAVFSLGQELTPERITAICHTCSVAYVLSGAL